MFSILCRQLPYSIRLLSTPRTSGERLLISASPSGFAGRLIRRPRKHMGTMHIPSWGMSMTLQLFLWRLVELLCGRQAGTTLPLGLALHGPHTTSKEQKRLFGPELAYSSIPPMRWRLLDSAGWDFGHSKFRAGRSFHLPQASLSFRFRSLLRTPAPRSRHFLLIYSCRIHFSGIPAFSRL